MRHQKRSKRLSRPLGHRRATLRNLVISLLKYQRIKTTRVKAKLAQSMAERLISLAKKDTVQTRRHAYKILNNRSAISSLFLQTVPLFKNKTSGFTRIIRFKYRAGDGADLVFLELTEKTVKTKPVKTAKLKAAAEPSTSKKPAKKLPDSEKLGQKAQTPVEQTAEPVEQAPEQQVKFKPKEKPASSPGRRVPPKEEKPKKFLGNLRRLFKKERDSL